MRVAPNDCPRTWLGPVEEEVAEDGAGDRGDGKSADFGRVLFAGGPGEGDGDDCLMKGLLRTVPMLQRCCKGSSSVEPRRVGTVDEGVFDVVLQI